MSFVVLNSPISCWSNDPLLAAPNSEAVDNPFIGKFVVLQAKSVPRDVFADVRVASLGGSAFLILPPGCCDGKESSGLAKTPIVVQVVSRRFSPRVRHPAGCRCRFLKGGVHAIVTQCTRSLEASSIAVMAEDILRLIE